MTTAEFRSVYSKQGRYDELLLPHIFGTKTDVDLIADRMKEHYGEPAERTLAVCDLGCGTGRVTAALEPYATSLVGVDSSEAMVRAFTEQFPAREPSAPTCPRVSPNWSPRRSTSSERSGRCRTRSWPTSNTSTPKASPRT